MLTLNALPHHKRTGPSHERTGSVAEATVAAGFVHTMAKKCNLLCNLDTKDHQISISNVTTSSSNQALLVCEFQRAPYM